MEKLGYLDRRVFLSGIIAGWMGEQIGSFLLINFFLIEDHYRFSKTTKPFKTNNT